MPLKTQNKARAAYALHRELRLVIGALGCKIHQSRITVSHEGPRGTTKGSRSNTTTSRELC